MFSTEFNIWFEEGIHHILTLEALDHILFITALCISFSFSQWKKTVLMVTAFTIGHSITLAAVALGYLHVNTKWVEFLIPLTIAFTAGRQLLRPADTGASRWLLYGTVLFFGFIHGMAYGAAQIGSMYSRSEAIPLVLAFNLGIEAAQLAVVGVVLLLSFIVVRLCKIPETYWRLLLSSLILLYALYLAVQHHPF